MFRPHGDGILEIGLGTLDLATLISLKNCGFNLKGILSIDYSVRKKAQFEITKPTHFCFLADLRLHHATLMSHCSTLRNGITAHKPSKLKKSY
jgi:hypothetical protein